MASQPITDHEQIRQWAEERNARPASVKNTGGKGDPGMIRLDFPGFSGEDSLQEISWDDWFKAFDENKLALLVQDRTAGGQASNFNKLVSRGGSPRAAAKRRSSGGSGSTRTAGRKAPASAAKRATAGARKSGSAAKGRGASKAAAGAAKGRGAGAKRARSNRKTAGAGGARKAPKASASKARGSTRKATGRTKSSGRSSARKTASKGSRRR